MYILPDFWKGYRQMDLLRPTAVFFLKKLADYLQDSHYKN